MIKRKIKSTTEQRPFIIIYKDFLESDLLDNHYQKLVYIYLKKFANSKNQCFPSIKTLAELTKISKNKIKTTLLELEQKGIISKEKRMRPDGGKSSNLYTLYDFKNLWKANNTKESITAIDEYETDYIISILESKGYTVQKTNQEKGLETTVPTKATVNSSTHNDYQSINDNNINTAKNQEEIEERYPLTFLKTSLHYNDMLIEKPNDQNMIDTFFHYLYVTMNTSKGTIRVHGEDKPKETVISVLAKLEYYDFLYAVEKYKENTSKVEHQGAYIVTLLYNAKAQNEADITNRVRHDMYEYVNSPEYRPPCSETAPEKNRFYRM